MLLIILAIALWIVGWSFGEVPKYSYYREYGWKSLCCWALALAFVFVALVVGSGIAKDQSRVEKTQLGSLQDNRVIDGHFVLGSGTIGENPAYTYYENLGGSQYRQRILEDDGQYPITVVEDTDQPYVEKQIYGATKGLSLWGLWPAVPDRTMSVTFHVPKGSVVQNYTLNSRNE